MRVIKTSGIWSGNIISYLGDLDDKEGEKNEKEIHVPIIGAALGFCLIALIAAIFVYYCKVVKKAEETEVKHEDTEYYPEDLPYEENYYDSIKWLLF